MNLPATGGVPPLAGVQDGYQNMAGRQLYDTSDPKNMAMSVSPRANVKINEGMVAESAQRAALRDSMNRTQGGMVSTDALKRMANREAQARLAPQRALAQREDVSSQSGRGFTRTVDRDPDSPTFGRATVVGTRPVYGPKVTDSVKSYLDQGGSINAGTPDARPAKSALMTAQQPRRDARMAGEVFEDTETGAITDYGKLNARNQRRAEESQAARELRTRTAQVQGMNPRLSRAGAAGVAAGQLRNEQLMQDQMKRQSEAEQFGRDLQERELQLKEEEAERLAAKDDKLSGVEALEAKAMEGEAVKQLVNAPATPEGLKSVLQRDDLTEDQKKAWMASELRIGSDSDLRRYLYNSGLEADGYLADEFTNFLNPLNYFNFYQTPANSALRDSILASSPFSQ